MENINHFFEKVREQNIVRPVDRTVGGVCGALANRYGWKIGRVKLVFFLLTVFAGVGILAYGALMMILPDERDSQIALEEIVDGRLNGDMIVSGAIALIGLAFGGTTSLGILQLHGLQAIMAIAFWLVALPCLVFFIVHANNRSKNERGYCETAEEMAARIAEETTQKIARKMDQKARRFEEKMSSKAEALNQKLNSKAEKFDSKVTQGADKFEQKIAEKSEKLEQEYSQRFGQAEYLKKTAPQKSARVRKPRVHRAVNHFLVGLFFISAAAVAFLYLNGFAPAQMRFGAVVTLFIGAWAAVLLVVKAIATLAGRRVGFGFSFVFWAGAIFAVCGASRYAWDLGITPEHYKFAAIGALILAGLYFMISSVVQIAKKDTSKENLVPAKSDPVDPIPAKSDPVDPIPAKSAVSEKARDK